MVTTGMKIRRAFAGTALFLFAQPALGQDANPCESDTQFPLWTPFGSITVGGGPIVTTLTHETIREANKICISFEGGLYTQIKVTPTNTTQADIKGKTNYCFDLGGDKKQAVAIDSVTVIPPVPPSTSISINRSMVLNLDAVRSLYDDDQKECAKRGDPANYIRSQRPALDL